MPDFTGTYQLAGNPPDKWEERLQSLATSAGVELQPAANEEGRLAIKIRAPAGTSTGVSASEVASRFFNEARPLLSSADALGSAQFLGMAPNRPRRLRARPLVKALGVVLLWALSGLLISMGMTKLALFFHDRGAIWEFLAVMGGSILAIAGTFVYRHFASDEDTAPEDERKQQAVQERALVQEVTKGEDPAMRARLELARISLRMRASSMRSDADRLWSRSQWAYRAACGFFGLSLAGPVVAATLLLTTTNPDWHFMFGGLSLAAVPLAIGTALLRHDTKLREQYQDAARDVASLERYELALDYSRISSQKTYQTTMQQVITQLLTLRGGTSALSPVANAHVREPEKDGKEESSGVKRLLEVTTEKAGEVVAAIVPSK